MNPTLARVLTADNNLSEMKKEEERLRLDNEQKDEDNKRMVIISIFLPFFLKDNLQTISNLGCKMAGWGFLVLNF